MPGAVLASEVEAGEEKEEEEDGGEVAGGTRTRGNSLLSKCVYAPWLSWFVTQ